MAKEESEETITISKNSFYGIIIGVLVLLLIGSIFTGGFGIVKQPQAGTGSGSGGGQLTAPSPSPTPTPLPLPTPSGPNVKMSQIMDDDPKIGSDSAPVVIVEFSDFQCPFCAKAYNEALTSIKNDYVKSGKVQIVYRDYTPTLINPLYHPNAVDASMAAECSKEQGKWEEMHNMLFEKQGEWSSVGKSKFKEYATTLGLDTAKFNTCLDSEKYKSKIQKDLQDGDTLGVDGTPTFFIGKRDGTPQKIVGAQPYSVFKQAIDGLLAG